MQSHSHSPQNPQHSAPQQPSDKQARKKETGSNADWSVFLQTKLTVNTPGDRYEREADAVADRIMRMPNGAALTQPSLTPVQGIQRKCAACEEEEEEETLQRKESAASTPIVTPSLSAQLSSTRGGGTALPVTTQSFMSQAFGTDFSGVRVHTDGAAASMSQQLNARAFTHGSDIYFNRGEYSPESPAGKRLLGHELTHVVQQSKGYTSGSLQRGPLPEIQSRQATEEIGVTHVEDNGVVQREETHETRDPTPEEIKDKESEVTKKADDLIRYIGFEEHYDKKRAEWLKQVFIIVKDSELEEDSDISDIYSAYLNALERLELIEKDIAFEVEAASHLLTTAIEKYEAEIERLNRVPSLSNGFALKALQDVDNLMNHALKYITLLTQADVLQYYNFLSNDKHIKIGEQKAESISGEKQRQEDAQKLEEALKSKSRGVVDAIKGGVGVVWDVVGCSSLSECALDLGLTVLTAGAAKAGKTLAKGGMAAVKGRKAGTAVSKVTKARKITPTMATKIGERALKNALNIKKLKAALSAICSSMDTAGGWMKDNMPQLMGEFVSGHTTGQPEGAASVVMKRIRKDQIESFYELILSKPNGEHVIWGVTALFAGRGEVGKLLLKTFLKQSITFRGAVNITDQLISNLPDSNFTAEEIQAQLLKSIRGALSNIVRESLQDIINNIPLGKEIVKDSFLTTISEGLLRSIQKSL